MTPASWHGRVLIFNHQPGNSVCGLRLLLSRDGPESQPESDPQESRTPRRQPVSSASWPTCPGKFHHAGKVGIFNPTWEGGKSFFSALWLLRNYSETVLCRASHRPPPRAARIPCGTWGGHAGTRGSERSALHVNAAPQNRARGPGRTAGLSPPPHPTPAGDRSPQGPRPWQRRVRLRLRPSFPPLPSVSVLQHCGDRASFHLRPVGPGGLGPWKSPAPPHPPPRFHVRRQSPDAVRRPLATWG